MPPCYQSRGAQPRPYDKALHAAVVSACLARALWHSTVWAMELAESTTSPQRSLFSDTKTHPTIATSAGAAKYMVIMCRGTLPALCRCQTGLRRHSRPVRDP